MNKQEANKKLSEMVETFNKALRDAEAFATEHKLSFSIDPCYGAGASFDGAEVGIENYQGNEDGWYASSQSC